ncbi:MAG TPA: ribosome maturation factor RimM [Xanthobacteraceae bacterium]|nr:ribosome maturation factor RimM [Xanthobacteraceae bacterium]
MSNRHPQHNARSPRRASRAAPLPQEKSGRRICLGQIGAPHGVRGEVRLRSFTSDPGAIAGYGLLETEDGRTIAIERLQAAKDHFKHHFIARLSGVHDRSAAERMTNVKLYVPRERLPEPSGADEFYHADLIGLAVCDPAGKRLGTVAAIYNFGAGDLIEVERAGAKSTQLLPFDAATVPEVDVAAGRIIVVAPKDMFAPSPLAREAGAAKPSRAKGRTKKNSASQPPRRSAGSSRRRSALSRKGGG